MIMNAIDGNQRIEYAGDDATHGIATKETVGKELPLL
jgi:hypothetical protein